MGIVSDIQRFSLHDGPGIRTTVFLKGCQLRCRWCHNPETLRPRPEIQLFPDKCIGCGACLTACPNGAHVADDGRREFLRDRCQACGRCAETCYAEAIVLVGRERTVEEVLGEVLADRDFYRHSGGGMTLSGGEPLYQPAFCEALLAGAKDAALHTAVETNLAWPAERVEAILPTTDLLMADLKHMDPAAHERWTGVGNEAILANLEWLGGTDTELIVRTPVVPGVNDAPEQIAAIARFLARLGSLRYYELLAYHPLGTGKYASLGLEYELPDAPRPEADRMAELADAARAEGVRVRAPGEEEPL